MKQRAAVSFVVETHQVTERRACRVLKVNRTAYRYEPVHLPDEDEVRAEIIEKATNYGRVGYCGLALCGADNTYAVFLARP